MKLLIFDLDGTLIDSQLDLANSVNAMRIHMGMEPLLNSTIYSYVGNGAPTLVRRALGNQATDSDVERGLAYFLDYYWEHILDHTVLYDGVQEALNSFHDSNKPMAILTNKPIRFTRAIVEGLDIGHYFFQVYGGNSFEQKKPDPVGIEKLLQESSTGRESALMIGDSAVDIRTARNARVKACGVTYGFQPETLKDDPPDYLLSDLRELIPIVATS